MQYEPGFYWAREKDGGGLTVLQIDEGRVLLLNTDDMWDFEEMERDFKIVSRIPEPV